MPNVPNLKFSFIGSDILTVESILIFTALRKNGIFIPENDGAYPGKTRPNLDDLILDMRWKHIEVGLGLRTGAYKANVAQQDVQELRDLVELRGSENAAEQQDTWVAFPREQTARQVRAGLPQGKIEHRKNGKTLLKFNVKQCNQIDVTGWF